MIQPTWGSNLVRESAQGPDSGRFTHKFETFGGRWPVARGPWSVARGPWPVAGDRWPYGLVALWPCGPVARWPGGPVARWPGGPVARGRWPIGGEATNQ